MPKSKCSHNGLTDSEFYANSELRLMDKMWLSPVGYVEGEPYIVPGGWYRAVVTVSNCATYMVVNTRRGKSPSVLLLDIETREPVWLKTSARMRKLWEKLLWKAEWTHFNHVWDQIAAGTYKRPYPEALTPSDDPDHVELALEKRDHEYCRPLGIVVPFPAKMNVTTMRVRDSRLEREK